MRKSARRGNQEEAALKPTAVVKPLLNAINWSFSTPFSVGRSGMRLFDCRKYHWYPATFIPEIPYTLVEILTQPHAVVYDPFAGIGTTLFQSLMLGRQPVAAEQSRVAVEFMRSLWTLLNPETDLTHVEAAAEDIRKEYSPGAEYADALLTTAVNVEGLRPWYSIEVFNKICYLIIREKQETDPVTKSAMRITISSTLKAACAQNRGWGCIADNMLPKVDQLKKPKTVLSRFSAKMTRLARDLEDIRETLPLESRIALGTSKADEYIHRADCRTKDLIPEKSVDLIVTSPPYPNMTDYSTSQRLSYYWLGHDPAEDLAAEIGARRKRFLSTSLELYGDHMREALGSFLPTVKEGGYACFVMPVFNTDNINNTERRQVVQDCLAAVLGHGFLLEHELTRLLPTRRRHHNQGWLSLEREVISIFKRL